MKINGDKQLINQSMSDLNTPSIHCRIHFFSTTPTDLVVEFGTGKKGKVGGLTYKNELDVYMASLNAAGCSQISSKVTINVP